MTVALLIEMGWKSGLVAAVALLGAVLIRARPAAERVAVLRLGVVLVLALPLLSLLMPAMRVQTPAFAPPTGRPAVLAETGSTAAPRRVEASTPVLAPVPTTTSAPAAVPPAPPAPARSPSPAFDPGLALLAAYALGVALLTAHLLAGVATLSRWTRRARPITDPAWLDALDRAAQGRRRPALLASSQVSSPLSWGWRPAVILVNEDALPHADRADAVLAHEMGHVRRGDWLFLMLSRAAVALFWFNPLVWLLQRELARQSERAVDAWAVRHVGRADYASALVAMAGRRPRPQAALGMAGPSSDLARRVAAVLAGSRRTGRPWPTAIAALACVGLATPLAAVELSARTVAPGLSAAPVRTAAAPLPPLPPVPVPTFEIAPAVRPGEAADAERLALVLRQRQQGLTLMEAGARVMEERARYMRELAARLPMDEDDRAGLIADAAELDRDAEELRGEARELAAQDPATLRPLSPAEERELVEGMRQVIATGAELADKEKGKQGPGVQIDASGALRTDDGLERDASGAVRTPNGVQIDASGAVRTPSGAQIDASGVIRTPVQVAVNTPVQLSLPAPAPTAAPASPAPPADIAAHVAEQQAAARLAAQQAAQHVAQEQAQAREQRREGARQMRQGADQMDAAALVTELSAATAPEPARREEIRARAADLRRQASDLRRDAGVMEAGAP